MAWIKFKNIKGEVFTVPESTYNIFFKDKDGFVLVQESEPTPIKKQEEKIEKIKDEEVKPDESTQETVSDERQPDRKSTKKANS